MIRVTVAGCDGGYPGPGGAGSCYLVESATTKVLLDMGPGGLGVLQGFVTLDSLDAVVVSHEHPDHREDLDSLAVALHFHPDHPSVPLFAPASVARWRYFGEWGEVPHTPIQSGDAVVVGDMSLRFFRTDHGPETLAVRIDVGDSSVGYSADTGAAWSVEEMGPGIDMYLCEATWTREREGGAQHLSGRQAGRQAREAGVDRLIVTHRWPTADERAVVEEAAEAFGRAVSVARPGARFYA